MITCQCTLFCESEKPRDTPLPWGFKIFRFSRDSLKKFSRYNEKSFENHQNQGVKHTVWHQQHFIGFLLQYFFFFFFAEKLSLSVVFYKILWVVGATCARVSNRVAVSSVILISLSFLPQTTGRKAKQQLKTLAGAF